MPPYSPDPHIFDHSINELQEIMRWISKRDDRRGTRNTYLIGGWAVYSYNPTLKSVDIDLVTNSKTRSSLIHYLRSERAYQLHPIGSFTTVSKNTPYGDIIIDFATASEPCKFLGRNEELSFKELKGRSVMRSIGEGHTVLMPERTLLLLFKLKAMWDRKYRIENDDSCDMEWEQGKLAKDRSDVIALLDPEYGGRDIDLMYLGEKLSELSFLRDNISRLPEQIDSITRYGKMSQKDVKQLINSLLTII